MSEPASRSSVHIEAELKQSYMDYAMSVIIGRALPDIRDGLKPGQRRVLYAMYREGLLPGRSHSKCAGIVGEVLKKYHPHGDQSVYDTLVRLAQAFSLRHMLVDGKGNFGSVDGDPPAAYRYTEARLTPFSAAMLADIDRNTVDFAPNFDGKTVEPEVLPTATPNLLVNGADGIAVGMATKIPPHNLREITNALVHVIEHPGESDGELNAALLRIVTGPDFPTGARIHGRHGIAAAYRTGRGVIQVRAVADFETGKSGRQAIIVTEIPYQVNKARLIEKIADLVKDKRIAGISDLRDESDRRGMRIVIELKRGEEPQIVLNNLYKQTALQSSFGINLLAIAGRRPRLLSLAEMLRLFLDFRRRVVRRRVQFELDKCEKRIHLLEGLAAAVDRLDEVIEWIRSSASPEEARRRLMERLRPKRTAVDAELLRRSSNGAPAPDTEPRLDQEQAQAILDMRLQRLTQMEREKIETEMSELAAQIRSLREILDDPQRVDAIVRDEAIEVAEKYGDDRRTEIVDEATDIAIEELIPEEDIVISVTHGGYIKRTALSEYRAQGRGGTGHSGAGIKSGDAIRNLLIGSTHSRLLFLADDGKAYRRKGYELPEAGKAGTGRAIVNLLDLPKERRIVAVVQLPDDDAEHESRFLLTVTRSGRVKRTLLSRYRNMRRVGLRAVVVNEGDALLDAVLTTGESHVVLVTENGKAIHFHESDVRATGRVSAGFKGIALDKGDRVVALVSTENGGSLLTVTRHGYGKMTPLEQYRTQKRAGKGLRNIRSSERNGPTVAAECVVPGEDILAITAGGKAVRIPVEDFRDIGRATKGVRVIRLRDDDEVVTITRVAAPDPDDEATAEGSEGSEASEERSAEEKGSEGAMDEKDDETNGAGSD